MNIIHQKIQEYLSGAGLPEVEFSQPPKPEMGDVAFACFELAKQKGKNPAEVAQSIAGKIVKTGMIADVKAFGPYVNIFLDSTEVAQLVLEAVDKDFGKHENLSQKISVFEFAHPNTHKAFHIGHLRNIITGESLALLTENLGRTVHRVNYQGDVGMHVAKSVWGIQDLIEEYQSIKDADIDTRVKFLGKAYAHGSSAYEKDESKKAAIQEINKKIYTQDVTIQELYTETRSWSLEYFDKVYHRVGTKFERLYFESEVADRGKELVEEYIKTGVFKRSDGAIIFEGSKHGLHDRVFINSKGFPTYEGKEIGLAEIQFNEYNPEEIIHITGSEQSDYFKVVFEAISHVFPDTKGKEKHIPYGWVRLKKGKMSSRLGNVVLGEDLLDIVEQEIAQIMEKVDIKKKEEVVKKIAQAAVKYAFIKTRIKNDIAFDLEESVSLSGDSGPYLLYVNARIHSILNKAEYFVSPNSLEIPAELHQNEKQLLLLLAEYPQKTFLAADSLDPSIVARYLFDLAQEFNSFYANCPVIQEDKSVQNFRLGLIARVSQVMEAGLGLLGIEVVGEM